MITNVSHCVTFEEENEQQQIIREEKSIMLRKRKNRLNRGSELVELQESSTGRKNLTRHALLNRNDGIFLSLKPEREFNLPYSIVTRQELSKMLGLSVLKARTSPSE